MKRFHRESRTRTLIRDLPETAVALSADSLRIAAGGLRRTDGCGGTAAASTARQPTNVITGGDWDTD